MRQIVFLVVFGIAGCAVLIGLGNWQVQRLAWKQDVLAQIETRIAAPPEPLPTTFNPDADRYRPVTLTGEFLAGELLVLVSRKRVGAGYLVISPFETDDGRRVLVDRGFIRTEDRTTPRSIGPAEVTGNLHWPRETDGFTPDPDGETWFARDVPLMARDLDTEEVLIVAASQTDPGVTPLRVDTTGIPNDHLGYAVTWYSLAFIWALMTGFFLWRSRAKTKG